MIRRYVFLLSAVVLSLSCSDDPTGPAPPELSIEYTTLDVEVLRYIDKEVQFRIRNTGEDDLVITNAQTDVNWMTADPESMTVVGGGLGVFTLTISTDQVSYNVEHLFGRFRFETNDPGYPHVQISVDVSIELAQYDNLTIYPTTLLFPIPTNSDTSATLSVSNPSPYTFSIEAVYSQFDWISVTPDTMTLNPGGRGTMTLTASSADMESGTYQGSVTIDTDDPYAGSSGNIVVTVTLNVGEDLAPSRVVIAEEFTGTWCQFCPASMEALHDLQGYAPSNVAVLAYHIDDDFEVIGNETRRQYYGIISFPHVQIDGVIPVAGATEDFTPEFEERYEIPVDMSLRIILTEFDESSGIGAAEVRMNSLVDSTLSFNFRMFLTGLDSTYSWQEFDHLYNTVLSHVSGTAGTAIQLDPLAMETREYDFTVPGDWRGRECELVGFAQHDPTDEILQGAKASVP